MLDPQTLYAACRELEDATGREIVPPNIMQRRPTGSLYIWDDYRCYEVSNDDLVADILEARLWRAVREWAVSREFGCIHQADRGYFVWDPRTVNCRAQDPIVQYTHDLPAAAHAIAEWCKANRTTPV